MREAEILLAASAWASSLQTEKPTSIFTISPTLAPTQNHNIYRTYPLPPVKCSLHLCSQYSLFVIETVKEIHACWIVTWVEFLHIQIFLLLSSPIPISLSLPYTGFYRPFNLLTLLTAVFLVCFDAGGLPLLHSNLISEHL